MNCKNCKEPKGILGMVIPTKKLDEECFTKINTGKCKMIYTMDIEQVK